MRWNSIFYILLKRSSFQMNRSLFVLMIFALPSVLVYSQNFQKEYHPCKDLRIDSLILLQTKEQLIENKKIAVASEKKRDVRITIGSSFDNIYETLNNLDTSRLLMINNPISQYIQLVLKRILEGNRTILEDEYYVYLRRTTTPNASSLSSRIVLINLGLFQYLSDETELAFVLCHELSHDYLKHVINNIIRISQIKNDA